MFDKWIQINKNGTIGSHSIGKWICDSCGMGFQRPKRVHEKTLQNSVYQQKDICRRCVSKFVNTTDSYRNKQKEVQLKMYKLYPERRERISKTLIANKVNVGSKNGMKSLDARKKVSESRKNMSSEIRKIYAESSRRAWREGKFDGVKVGRCKWYVIQTSNGLIKVQGTWELKYAEYLLKNNINFYAHRGRISYQDEHGNLHSYYPDFYLPDENRYIDIKAPYFYETNKNKIELIRKQYPNLILDIITYKKTTNSWEKL